MAARVFSASIELGDDPREITVAHVPSHLDGHPRPIVYLGGGLTVHCADTPASVLLALAEALTAVAHEKRQAADQMGDAA